MALNINGNVYAFGRSDQGQLGSDTRMPNQEKGLQGRSNHSRKLLYFQGKSQF
jgi:alpha-tubulin suppressor-like RCC1 family protein